MKSEVTVVYCFGVRGPITHDQLAEPPWRSICTVNPEAVFGLREGYVHNGYEVTDIQSGQLYVFEEGIEEEDLSTNDGNVVPIKFGKE